METMKETIKEAMGILKSVRVRTEFEMEQIWNEFSGYDAEFDQKMKRYFKIISPLQDRELHSAMCDVWNATLEFYYTEKKVEECPLEAMTDEKRMWKSVTAEDKKRKIKRVEIVVTGNGRKVLVSFLDGSKAIRTLYQEKRKEEMLNFDGCEKELIDLAELGTKDYRSALQSLLNKYSAN